MNWVHRQFNVWIDVTPRRVLEDFVGQCFHQSPSRVSQVWQQQCSTSSARIAERKAILYKDESDDIWLGTVYSLREFEHHAACQEYIHALKLTR